jgi:tetratricopeptide (TPR) repeat protein
MFEMGDYELHSTESIFQTGLDFLESDHFEEALRAFEFIVDKQPQNVDAIFHRGIALVNLSRPKEAIEVYHEAIALAPTDSLLHCHCGYAYLISGDPDEALRCLDQALDIQPDQYQAKIYKACALAEKRMFAAARELFEQVLAERPEEHEALRHYAAVLAATGEESKALIQLNAILAKQPNNREALRNKAIVLMRQGRRDEAVCCLRELTAIAPSDSAGWMMLTEVLAEMRAWPELTAIAGMAMEAGHENSEFYMLRGRGYLEQGQAEMAIANLWRSRNLNDRNPEVFYYLSQALLLDGKLRHSLKMANRAIQMKPDERRFVLLKAEVLHRIGDFAGELNLVNLVLQSRPEDFDFICQKVRCLGAQDRLGEASTFVDRFIVRLPEHVGALLVGADLSEKLGDMEKAQRYFSRIFQLNPIGPYVYQAYSSFLVRRGAPERALAVLTTAKLEHPSDPTIEASRIIALQNLGRHAQAVELAEEFLELEDSTADLHWLASRSFYALGHFERALLHLQEARKVVAAGNAAVSVPTNWLVAEAFTLHRVGKSAEGIQLLEKYAPQQTYAEPEYYLALGELCEVSHFETKGLATYGEALQAYPENGTVHYRLARLCALLGKKTTALDHLRRAISLDPSLGDLAVNEPAFRRYAFSPAMNRVLGLRFVSRRIKMASLVTAWSIGVVALSQYLK